MQRGGGGGNPNSPLRRSVLAGGPGGIGDLNAPRNSRRKWAELTPKERERILQSRTEGFPAGYEEILGEYYRRLATEDSVRAIAPSAEKLPPERPLRRSPAEMAARLERPKTNAQGPRAATTLGLSRRVPGLGGPLVLARSTHRGRQRGDG